MRIRMIFTSAVLLALTLGAPAGAARAANPSLNDLIEQARKLDGQEVTVQGEVVGDIMIRGDHGWVNINDGTGAMGIWVPSELLRTIKHAGRYGVQGDTVTVTGTFYRMDVTTGGELDIQARQLTIVSPGGGRSEPVATRRIVWVFVVTVAMGAAAGLLAWHRRAKGDQP